MKVRFNFVKFLLFVFLIGIISGCTNNENKGERESKVKGNLNYPIEQSLTKQAKKQVLNSPEITDVKGVNTGKDVVIAVKVKQFDRFRLKEIQEKLQTNLNKSFPKQTVEVSTDQKIYWELDKLEVQLNNQGLTAKELSSKLDKIKKLMKEQT